MTATGNPNGSATQYRFDDRQGGGAWSQGPPADAGSGRSAASESADLTGLQPSTTYGYRISATNSAGTTTGAERVFTTAATPPPAPPSGLSGDATASAVALSWTDNSS